AGAARHVARRTRLTRAGARALRDRCRAPSRARGALRVRSAGGRASRATGRARGSDVVRHVGPSSTRTAVVADGFRSSREPTGPRRVGRGERMNILLITTDQQRADTLGAAGSPLAATPRLDALAAEGTRYSTARTQNPLCQPARASILTGTYPSTHGVTCNGIDLPADADQRSIATLLSRAGYRTGIIGKAHFATTFPFFPTGRLESVDGSARVDPEWRGPYFGFE